MPHSVLIVEDEIDLADLLAHTLGREHFRTEVVLTGEEALARLDREPLPDLVLLDRMLPGVSGDEVLARLRADPRTRALPVVILTARTAETDRIRGLDLGADDYVVKPFSVREVVLRVRGILRRVEHGSVLVLDEAGHRARVGSRAVDLTPLEVSLLSALRDGVVWSREDLVTHAWRDRDADIEVVDSAVKRLRAKLEPLGLTIVAMRNAGFRLDPLAVSSSS